MECKQYQQQWEVIYKSANHYANSLHYKLEKILEDHK